MPRTEKIFAFLIRKHTKATFDDAFATFDSVSVLRAKKSFLLTAAKKIPTKFRKQHHVQREKQQAHQNKRDTF